MARIPTTAALLQAISDRDEARVRDLLARGADAGAATPTGETPVHRAVLMQAPAVLRLLLDAGARADGAEEAICLAATWGSVDLTRMLLEAGASPRGRVKVPHDPWRDGHSAVHHAVLAQAGDPPGVLALLFAAGADPNDRSSAGRGPCLVLPAAARIRTMRNPKALDPLTSSILDVLLAAGADVHVRDRAGLTARMWCRVEGALGLDARLAELGASLSGADEEIARRGRPELPVSPPDRSFILTPSEYEEEAPIGVDPFPPPHDGKVSVWIECDARSPFRFDARIGTAVGDLGEWRAMSRSVSSRRARFLVEVPVPKGSLAVQFRIHRPGAPPIEVDPWLLE